MVAYAPTNTVILTDSASNIRRLLTIIDPIDVETYKEELADPSSSTPTRTVVADQLSRDLRRRGRRRRRAPGRGGVAARARGRSRRARQPPQAAQTPEQVTQRGQVRIITDERTNSLIVLARARPLEDDPRLIAQARRAGGRRRAASTSTTCSTPTPRSSRRRSRARCSAGSRARRHGRRRRWPASAARPRAARPGRRRCAPRSRAASRGRHGHGRPADQLAA